MSGSDQFQLRNDGDSTFNGRVDSVFSSLQSMEQKYQENVKKDFDSPSPSHVAEKKNFDSPSQSRGADQKFDVPRSIKSGHHFNNRSDRRYARRRNRVPDHVLNPEKYTKYSLYFDGTNNESSTSGLKGDQLNKKIATDFIASLRERRQTEQSPRKRNADDDGGDDEDTKCKHVYKAPLVEGGGDNDSTATSSKKKKNSNEPLNKNTIGSSHASKAVVMDTFQFGNNTKKTRKINDNVSTIDVEEASSTLTRDTNVPSLSYDFHDDVKGNEVETNDEQTSTLENVSCLFKSRKKKKPSYRKRDTHIDSSLSEIPEEE